ncbi:protein TonB [Dysgonomonas sp. PH5-45]|uniref:energy transducer TonB n=1 Tax=unclassified Dysgonomonas TaxID=2630389 RepID=UPI002473D1C7|nr:MULTISPECIES: energy transducer TonB [unclassified Dysgonomonas]MDH6355908.1 protein TonB [Dysgonomonas sp. PH5-45]MDH6388784.1 protein TonB [Dysgonomonas sp. PH5-37]
MARDIKLNSKEWCDVVFENKNKAYGAYELRKTSSKRHIMAFGTVVLFVGLVIAIPSFIKAVTPDKQVLGSVDGPHIFVNVAPDEPEDPEVILPPKQEIAPPKVLAKETIQFTSPAVVSDPDYKEAQGVKSSTELLGSKVQIDFVTNANGSKDPKAPDPELIKTQQRITGSAGGNGGEPTIRKFVERMPKFPGGDVELFRFLKDNIKYPSLAADNGLEGKVIITFVVWKDGSISNAKVVQGIDPSCDREALRVVKSMPPWIPGMQNGVSVPVEYTLPVTFKLQK